MDNILIEKIWHDKELMEIRIIAKTEFVNIYQECYIAESDFEKNIESIFQYIEEPKRECYTEYGNKKGNYTPAFSMLFLPIDVHGHIKIEMDIEIADNNTRTHRCLFYVNSEIGLLEQFAYRMKILIKAEDGYEIKLTE